MVVRITPGTYAQIVSHAIETFPNECCGIIVNRNGREEVVRVTNVQDEKHAADPQRYPRTAATAYSMGPEAAPILIEHERGTLSITAFYHSHPQHDAYFSEEDKRQATVWDEPSYPDAGQVVISIYDRVVKETKAFRWSEAARDFVAAELQIEEGNPDQMQSREAKSSTDANPGIEDRARSG